MAAASAAAGAASPAVASFIKTISEERDCGEAGRFRVSAFSLTSRLDDVIYEKHRPVWECQPRGSSRVEDAASGALLHTMCGLRKFSYVKTQGYGYPDQVKSVIALEKENGENAQISAFTSPAGDRFWLVGSKNVPILLRAGDPAYQQDLAAYSASGKERFGFAVQIAGLFYGQHLAPRAAGVGGKPSALALHEAIASSKHTIVAEAIFRTSQHLVDYGPDSDCVIAFALSPGNPTKPSSEGLTAAHPIACLARLASLGFRVPRVLGVANIDQSKESLEGTEAAAAAAAPTPAAAEEAGAGGTHVSYAIDGIPVTLMPYRELCEAIEALPNSEGAVMYGIDAPIPSPSTSTSTTAASAAPVPAHAGKTVFMYKWKSYEYVLGRRARTVIMARLPPTVLVARIRELASQSVPPSLISRGTAFFTRFQRWLSMHPQLAALQKREEAATAKATSGAGASAGAGGGEAAAAAAGVEAAETELAGFTPTALFPALTLHHRRSMRESIQSNWVTLRRTFETILQGGDGSGGEAAAAAAGAGGAAAAPAWTAAFSPPPLSSPLYPAFDAAFKTATGEDIGAAATGKPTGSNNAVVIMLQGVPLTGKSTLARSLSILLKRAGAVGRWVNQDEVGAAGRQGYIAALQRVQADPTVTHIILDKTNLNEENVRDYYELGMTPAATVRMLHPEDDPQHPDPRQRFAKLVALCESRFAERGERHRSLFRKADGTGKKGEMVDIRGILEKFVSLALEAGISGSVAAGGVASGSAQGTSTATDSSDGMLIEHNVLLSPQDSIRTLWRTLASNGLVPDVVAAGPAAGAGAAAAAAGGSKALTDADFTEALAISGAYEELVGLQGQARTRFWGLAVPMEEHARILEQVPRSEAGGPSLGAIPAKLVAALPALAERSGDAEEVLPAASPSSSSSPAAACLKPLSDAHRTLAFFNGMVDPELELAGFGAQGVAVPLRVLGFAWDDKGLAAVLDGEYTAREGVAPAAAAVAAAQAAGAVPGAEGVGAASTAAALSELLSGATENARRLPHITLAVAAGVQPVYSNEMLARHAKALAAGRPTDVQFLQLPSPLLLSATLTRFSY